MISKTLRRVVIVGMLVAVSNHSQGSCQFDLVAVKEGHHHPLLVQGKKMVYPELEGKTRVVRLTEGAKLLVACPGPNNAIAFSNTKVTDLTCSGDHLSAAGKGKLQKVTWNKMGCLRMPRPTVQPLRTKCGKAGVGYSVGWSLKPDLFLQQILICFNPTLEATEFTRHSVYGSHLTAKTQDPGRPPFKHADMFTANVEELYSKTNQRLLAEKALRSRAHLTVEGQQFLAKGHLAPDADFVYAAEQDATYYHANVVPQWQAFNNGNWKRLESAIRDLAKEQKTTLEVFTGTHGTLQLPDVNNNPVDLFLGLAAGKKLVPVPALMWKVIHDVKSRRAVGIVEVNDVTGEASARRMTLSEPPCRDVCNEVSWVDWDTSDISRGLTFCCQVKDLKSLIPTVPDLRKVSLLS
ncbi:uncharacterized protein [Procambarus clarkii]|uniref:uncharacterized protein isoform X1 n=1 Tax=Procambarus clarkii TaxID=6728 RepID=UPI00374324B6